jgi:hypothetical protein
VTLEPMPELRGSAAHSFAYYGNREGWLIALSVNRDSDALARSNWSVITADLFGRYGEGPETEHAEDMAIERMHHWACGWVDYLLVRPGSEAAQAANVWREKLDEYPVADEASFSELEFSEEWCTRCDRGTRAEHPLHGCPFRSADEADEIRYRWTHREVSA